MGHRSKLKQARRQIANIIAVAPDPDVCLKVTQEAVALGLLKPQKARELLEMRGLDERRKNLPAT